jgi:O-antigen/teichoic acid export membrane protein
MLVLVRLLDRSAYGQFSLVTSVTGFVAIFSFNNFVAYTVQVRRDDETHYQEHFTAGGVLQFGAFALTNIIALVLWHVPTYAAVSPLLHVMSLTFLLDWPCQLRAKMLEREFDWRRLRLLHAGGLLINAAFAIALGLAGAGVYALLIPGMLVTLPFMFDLFFVKRWRPTWTWSWKIYKPAWRFGVSRIGSGLSFSGRQIIESMVLAAVLGFSGLGVFNRAIALAQMFCTRLAIQLMTSIYPLLTRLDEQTGKATRAGDLILRSVTWIAIPIAVTFSLFAQPIVRTIYGERWIAIESLLPWTMALAALMAVFHAGYMLLLARQNAKKCLFIDIFLLVGTIASLVISFGRGARFYLICLLIVQLLGAIILVRWLRAAKAITMRGIAQSFIPALVSIAIAGGSVMLLARLFSSRFAVALILSGVLCGIYLIVLRLMFRSQLTELLRYFPARDAIAKVFMLQIGSKNSPAA